MPLLTFHVFWTGVGLVGAVLFFGRFYVQWIVSEMRKQIVIPLAFWYMSGIGSVLLFFYAYDRVSPGGTFGICFNIILYSRNIVHVWRERGTLTRTWNVAIHALAAAICVIATTLTFVTWRHGFENTGEFWFWSGIWVSGQILFTLRFFIQWVVTEMNRKSIVPPIFWYLSLAGVTLHGAYFFQRLDWLLAIGTVADAVPYIRNIWILRRQAENKTTEAG